MKIRMQRYGDFGWKFTVEIAKKVEAYRTNGEGEGLWHLEPDPSTWYADGSPVMIYRQIAGTCQFGLSSIRRKAYDHIRYMFREK